MFCIFGLKTKDFFGDLKKLEDLFDLSNLSENYEISSVRNEKLIGKFKIETRMKILMDGFICLRSKAYSFKRGSDNKKN